MQFIYKANKMNTFKFIKNNYIDKIGFWEKNKLPFNLPWKRIESC